MPKAIVQEERESREWSPAAKATTETTPIFHVKSGWRLLAASVRVITPLKAGSTGTLVVGDGGDTDRFITAAVVTETTAGIYDGGGAGFTPGGGYLYTTEDAIDVVYTADPTETDVMRCKFTMTYRKEE